MIDEVGITLGDGGLGTYKGTCVTGVFGAFVRQYLWREHAEELFLRKGFRFSETPASRYDALWSMVNL